MPNWFYCWFKAILKKDCYDPPRFTINQWDFDTKLDTTSRMLNPKNRLNHLWSPKVTKYKIDG